MVSCEEVHDKTQRDKTQRNSTKIFAILAVNLSTFKRLLLKISLPGATKSNELIIRSSDLIAIDNVHLKAW